VAQPSHPAQVAFGNIYKTIPIKPRQEASYSRIKSDDPRCQRTLLVDWFRKDGIPPDPQLHETTSLWLTWDTTWLQFVLLHCKVWVASPKLGKLDLLQGLPRFHDGVLFDMAGSTLDPLGQSQSA